VSMPFRPEFDSPHLQRRRFWSKNKVKSRIYTDILGCCKCDFFWV